MKSIKTLPCIVCGKKLKYVLRQHESGDGKNQPGKGVCFYSRGQYGSQVFDDFDGYYLEVNICDDCLRSAAEEQQVAVGRVHRDPLKIWAA